MPSLYTREQDPAKGTSRLKNQAGQDRDPHRSSRHLSVRRVYNLTQSWKDTPA